ncbi:MAG TPA: ABC-type transport auxiliary lipoprotein family protein [Candidatus Limnocylindria bacterium]|nr:ABC-type transport auxiliary lipoprotein family protein [Candidatus Limnocylindria bacterium]
MKMRRRRFSLYGILLSAALAGCVSLEKPYPDKRYFALEGPSGEASANPAAPGGVLLVSSLRVSPRYDGKSFIYRRGEANFESDFYNQFLVSPGAMLTEETRRGLAAAHVAQYVVGTSSQLEPTHVLEGTVDAFYGDFRDLSAPKAVLEMEFFLTKESPTRAEILTRRRYTKAVALKGRSAEALVQGWNQALQEILAALAADLKTVNF